jgi:hypothetical protein
MSQPTSTLAHRWNPPPGWPADPPPAGWTPPPDFPPAPAGWQFWTAYIVPARAGGGWGLAADGWVMLAGWLALLACPFLTWIHVVLLGDLNLFQLLVAGGQDTAVAWVVSAIGLVGAAVTLAVSGRTMRILNLIGSLIVGVLGILNLVEIVQAVSQSSGVASLGIAVLVGLGGVAAIAGAAGVGLGRTHSTR